jgi:hypothetical protein
MTQTAIGVQAGRHCPSVAPLRRRLRSDIGASDCRLRIGRFRVQLDALRAVLVAGKKAASQSEAVKDCGLSGGKRRYKAVTPDYQGANLGGWPGVQL